MIQFQLLASQWLGDLLAVDHFWQTVVWKPHLRFSSWQHACLLLPCHIQNHLHLLSCTPSVMEAYNPSLSSSLSSRLRWVPYRSSLRYNIMVHDVSHGNKTKHLSIHAWKAARSVCARSWARPSGALILLHLLPQSLSHPSLKYAFQDKDQVTLYTPTLLYLVPA